MSYVKSTREVLRSFEEGGRLNSRDGEGNTALHLAARLEDKESIMALLRHRAAMFVENKRKVCAFEVIPVDTLAEFLNSECIRGAIQ